MSRPKTVSLSGVVLDQNNSAVAGANISGRYGALVSRTFSTTTDRSGRFEDQRLEAPLVLHATSPDGQLAGIAEVATEAPEVTIRVGPTATVRGRLLDENGEALAEAKVQDAIRIDHEESGTSEAAFGSTVVTDENGRYTLSGLVPAYEYEVTYVEDSNSQDHSSATAARPVRVVAKVVPERSGVIDLGDTGIRRLGRPTTDEQIAKLFDARRPEREQIDEALSVANREQTRVLLVIGNKESMACRSLLELLYEDQEIRESAWNYEQIAIDTRDGDAARQVGTEYHVQVADPAQPVLVVLDSEGMPVAQRAFGGELGPDRDAVLNFLEKNAPELDDAEKVLADAMERARKENKRVLVQYSASWCGPCRLLSWFLDQHSDVFDRHFIRVKVDVDRSPNGQELMERHRRDGESIGIPWFAILDAEGMVLATSDGPEGNIGFPSAPEEISHFLAMLEQTTIRLSGDELNDIRRALEERAG